MIASLDLLSLVESLMLWLGFLGERYPLRASPLVEPLAAGLVLLPLSVQVGPFLALFQRQKGHSWTWYQLQPIGYVPFEISAVLRLYSFGAPRPHI